uniref:DYW domain-containing protein n=1 Tax=Kalanchoe fedtschenkoi TaxID=63787 RepID=A0A7N1A4Q1_KALFE
MFPLKLKLCPCGARPSVSQTKQAHARIVVSGLSNDAHLLAQLLSALALSSSTPLHYPLSIFNSLRYPSVFAANNLIRCFAKSDSPRKAVLFYASIRRRHLHVNNYTYPFLLQACSNASALLEGLQIHAHLFKLSFSSDLYVRNALIHFYSACSRIQCSARVFHETAGCRDVVTWNAMLAGVVRDGQIEDARKLFQDMPDRDDISWSTMIMGYVQAGMLEEGLNCFKEMRGMGVNPNEASLVTVLSASAQLGLLEHGKQVHLLVDSMNLPMTVSLGTALIDMYAKCGCINQSRLLFSKLPKPDIWSWNVMICGLASHGCGQEALALFEKFLSQGFHPANVTFVGVLNACSRAGLVSEGRHYFKLMREFYNLEPEMEHYGCMVDMLGRAGLIVEAMELIEKMQVAPDPVLWATLLGACKLYGLVELGAEIGNKLIHLDPGYHGHYVQLSGIYAKARKWEDVVRIRVLMADQNTSKVAGWSLIEAESGLHRFVAGDKEHPRTVEIYNMLETIMTRISEAGYTPNISSVLHDIGEEEKEKSIKEHSERLAIAFGFLVSGPGECIRIVKNLRVCADCHEATKIMSKVFSRHIVVRDGSRFHHFKDGLCSCNDYW